MYKIIAGSSCDLDEDMKENLNIDLVPFTLIIDGKEYIDDENLDLRDLIDNMNKSKEAAKTACPSPGSFLKAFEGYDNIFVITISKNLSGEYNSAVVAREMALEENPNKKIHIFNSKSASAGETLIALKLNDEIERGKTWEEIIEVVEDYIRKMSTFFILESLNNLIKNGRISKTSGLIAQVLNFKPIMTEDGEGNIILHEKIRGQNRAFSRLVDIIGEEGQTEKKGRLCITHVDAKDRAEELKEEIEKKYKFDEVVVLQTAGLCSVYADDGGIVLAY